MSRNRFPALLRAHAALTGELDPQRVLRYLADIARELVHAEYGAAALVGDDGGIDEFVYAGVAADVAQQIGNPPAGHGILGLLTNHPTPMRLPDAGAHPAAKGFPQHHPEIAGFLGVPIRVRNRVAGSLYVADRARGRFSAEDEQVVVALAVVGGVALDNARLHHEYERHRRWLAASTEVARRLFTGTDPRPLEMVLHHAQLAADADFATIALPVRHGQLVVEAALGMLAAPLVGTVVELSGSLEERVLRSGTPLRAAYAAAAMPREAGPVMAVPLSAGDGDVAVLGLGRARGQRSFTDADLDHLTAFARHAGEALEINQGHFDQQTRLLIEDSDRIRADLHDHVIQELFAIGMGLQGLAPLQEKADSRMRINGYVVRLDTAIRRIRSTIYDTPLHHHDDAGLQQRLLDVVEDESSANGPPVQLRFAGQLNQSVPPALVEHVVAVAREALSNIVRHAHASRASLSVGVLDGLVTVEIVDDGRGIGTTTRANGLANMRRRAETHGGTLSVAAPEGGGTHLIWTARVTPAT
ncbi:sensor histidine kinase [Lentzea tibetensis]|nr:GAF domain-containing protein [Lentzea tibetensis]